MLYLDGQPITECLAIQNGIGDIYAKGGNRNGPFYGFKLADFNTASTPAGYTKLKNASHRYSTIKGGYVFDPKNPQNMPTLDQLQLAWDFRGNQGTKITMDKDVYVRAKTATACFVWVKEGGHTYEFIFEHCQKLPARGATIQAGKPICEIGPLKSGAHLHHYITIDGKQLDLRAYYLQTNQPNMKYTKNTKLRQGDGLSYPQTGTIIAGAVGVIRDKPRVKDGYTWYDVGFGKDGREATGWAVMGAFTDEPVTNLNATPVVIPPVVPPVQPPIDPAVEKVKSGNFEVATKFENYKPVGSRIL